MKKQGMKRWLCIPLVVLLACNQKSPAKQFTINGTIRNSTARMVYLEEVPAGSTQGTIVDSSLLATDGKYKVSTIENEAMVYNLRLDRGMFPVAAVINDVPALTLDVEINPEHTEFAKSYEVKGSPASQKMKDFIFSFNNDLQKIYFLVKQMDSLSMKNAPDSVLGPLQVQQKTIAENIRQFAFASFEKANDPALVLFELGYYQETANNQRFGLQPIDIEQVIAVVDKSLKQFPSHRGLAAVKASLDKQLAEIRKPKETQWVGKPAPDFTLPDVNGKNVSLSSFKGKYVLIDFWASWCGPCREENPNVVEAYNQYKGKNFTVLGVSLDRPGQKDKWLAAIKADNLTWTHVSDLQYWNSSIIPLYQFDGIPFNVLVDPQGMVIAEGLRGPELGRKLDEVLK